MSKKDIIVIFNISVPILKLLKPLVIDIISIGLKSINIIYTYLRLIY